MSSTFAPPTGPPVSAATPTHEAEPVPATASGRRRRPFVLAAAVLAVIALGVGAVAAITSGRSDAEVAEPYSLIAAAESTISARTVDFDLTVSATDVAEMTVSGAVDNESRVVSVTTDLASLLALGDAPLPFDGTEITALVDASNGVIYLDADALGGFLPGDAAWVSIDLGTLAEQSGQTLDDLQGEFAVDPTDIARTLLDAGSATEVGVERIDGVDAKHFRVDVDIAAALADLAQADLDAAFGDVELPDTITYDVWVTADNQLRRVTFDIDVAGQSIGMQLDMTTSSEPLEVLLPDPSEVVDVTGLLGF